MLVFLVKGGLFSTELERREGALCWYGRPREVGTNGVEGRGGAEGME